MNHSNNNNEKKAAVTTTKHLQALIFFPFTNNEDKNSKDTGRKV